MVGYNWALDWLTFLFCLFNFVVVGVLSLFINMPPYIEKAYLIVISALLVRAGRC